MPATCDFVKKLYKYACFCRCMRASHHRSSRMLEDQSFAHVVSWGPDGDCFVVKVCPLFKSGVTRDLYLVSQDMNEFTKSILPRLFKHSNFASFVRQLNKYDFHKVSRSCLDGIPLSFFVGLENDRAQNGAASSFFFAVR